MRQYASAGRLVCALCLAAAVPSALGRIVSLGIGYRSPDLPAPGLLELMTSLVHLMIVTAMFVPFAILFGGGGLAMLLGWLLYLALSPALHRNSKAAVLACLLLGGVAANIQDFALELRHESAPSAACTFTFGDAGGNIIECNHRTRYGWFVFWKNASAKFSFGMLGGLIFWWIVRPRRSSELRPPMQTSSIS